jgi:hypothetical protein
MMVSMTRRKSLASMDFLEVEEKIIVVLAALLVVDERLEEAGIVFKLI